jgi:hypothetical protein
MTVGQGMLPFKLTPDTKKSIVIMALADLKADPDQPKKFFDPQALGELTAS